MPPYLTLMRYASRIGKAIQKKEYDPPLYYGVVAIEPFELLSTTVS